MERVAVFFSNPAAINPIVSGDVWLYRDVNTVVRYYVTHVLEYNNYRALDRSIPSNFVNNYLAALQFIEQDQLVTNESYLLNFRQEGGQYVFYFNYVVDNIPLVMPQNWPQNAALSQPIIVTAEHGTVVRYRKLAFNFTADETRQLRANAVAALGLINPRLNFIISDEDIETVFWLSDEIITRVQSEVEN